ncbi:MAG: putative DNA binding domain-containing protein [Chloroflexota bacterium]|nr:putative DNA binding domain-containing protein [Chloroflexota bacterium]MDE2908628.1 putative DNA binding domain-containing protein [Chloroflexota bacterium]
MVDSEQVNQLISRSESRTLDFKRTQYDLSLPRGSAHKGCLNLVKDVLCMSNTPREGSAFILTGIEELRGERNEVWGIKSSFDDSRIQDLLCKWLDPVPDVEYSEESVNGKKVGVFEITPDNSRGRPYMVRQDLNKHKLESLGNFLQPDRIYFRRGTTNAIARDSDKPFIQSWFHSDQDGRWQDWERFKETCKYFSEQRHYVLIASPLSHVDTNMLSSLSHVSWSAVIDFDPSSATNGLLKAIHESNSDRDIRRVVREEFPSFEPWGSTYWYFAMGLEGRKQTLLRRPDFNAWWNKYALDIVSQFRHIARTILPGPITFVVLWYENTYVRHLRTTLEATNAFDNPEYGIVSDSISTLKQRIDAELEPEYFEIPFEHLASGLSNEFASSAIQSSAITIPSNSGAPVEIPAVDLSWLHAQLDVIHLAIGTNSQPQHGASDFLRGGVVSWEELNLSRDVERDITARIQRQVLSELQDRTTSIVSLNHQPGAGGTTIARRVVWNLHRQFPTVAIHSSETIGIVDRIVKLFNLTKSPVLALADSADIAERVIEDIAQLLKSRNTFCVLLRVCRSYQLPTQLPSQSKRRSFNLENQLTSDELPRFYDKLASFVPARRDQLKRILATRISQERTAFHFGLTAFEKDYRGLKPYIGQRVVNLNDIQRKILAFQSIAYMYGQKGIPAQAFQYLLGIPSKRDVSLPHVFRHQQEVLDIIIHDGRTRAWRPIHNIVAEEVLVQLLTPPDADRRVWKQQLSTWGRRFVSFCGDGPLVDGEVMLEILRGVFIERGATEGDAFSQFVRDIPLREGRLAVLKSLAETFPEEAHFWGHLGRYYISYMKNYDDSLEAFEQALSLQPKDHMLWHMKGMSYRFQAQNMMVLSDRRNVQKIGLLEVVSLAEKASECFENSREFNPDHAHAYISEIQLLTKVLNYVGRGTGASVFQYIKRYDALPYVRDALDKAESLLSDVRSNREGASSNEREQRLRELEKNCRADITSIYGNYEEALQIWNSLLERQDVYHPPIRRQIIHALKVRKQTWDAMPQKNIERCITLLRQNLEQHPHSAQDLRLWLQAVRYASVKPSIESLIEQVSYWRSNTVSLEATYYLYVLYSLQALEGLPIELDLATRYIRDSANLSRNRGNRHKSFEWLGEGEGIASLVHQSVLGEWDDNRNFWTKPRPLKKRDDGVITKVDGPASGYIEIRGLSAFFVPAQKVFENDVNRRVKFFLGFSYSGLRAWDVEFL